MNDVTSLVTTTHDNRRWTLEQMLEAALAEVRAGELKANRAILLVVQDDDQEYEPCYRAANISCSQIIALCETGKMLAFDEMGYFDGGVI